MNTTKLAFNSLTTVNVELTSRCNKDCWMCGRRKVDRDWPDLKLKYGDMPFQLVQAIAQQLPDDIVVQLHNNGEPLLYPQFGQAAKLFHRQIVCTDTNGKLLLEKADEIIDHLDTLTVSTFEKDPEADTQYEIIQKFLQLKGEKKPNVIIRCLGNVNIEKYKLLNCTIATRILHNPMGSFKYTKNPTVPEIGICLDLLNHMAIRHDGKVCLCVRFDPQELGIIGDCRQTPLLEIWNSPLRKKWIRCHLQAQREKVPLCATCHFWGVPTGY